MAFSYDNLRKSQIDKKMLRCNLMTMTSITSTTMTRMGKQQSVSMAVSGRICKALDKNIKDTKTDIDLFETEVN